MTATVAALWSATWSRLAAVHPDIEVKLAQLEQARPTRSRSLERLAGAAGRASNRVVRGAGTIVELETRLRAWSDAVLDALAELDHAHDSQDFLTGRAAARNGAPARVSFPRDARPVRNLLDQGESHA